MVREIPGEFPKSFIFKLAHEACQGLPHHCHDRSLFTCNTLLKICRLNKPPGQYQFYSKLKFYSFPLFGRRTGLSKFSWSLSACRLSALCCPENGSGLKITILNLLEVCSVLILHNAGIILTGYHPPPGTLGLLHRNVCPAPGLLHNRKCPGAGPMNLRCPWGRAFAST